MNGEGGEGLVNEFVCILVVFLLQYTYLCLKAKP